MARDKKKDFLEKPQYIGGLKAMRSFIKENLKYPKTAAENKIEGYVHCRYRITHLGVVDEVKVISGLGYGCDEEAARLIKLFKFRLPKIPRKMRAHFHKTIRIHFKRNEVKVVKKNPTPAKTQITYTITSSANTLDSKKKQNYSYTIKLK